MFMIKHKESGMYWGPVRTVKKDVMDGTAHVQVTVKSNFYEDAGKTFEKKPTLVQNTTHWIYSHWSLGSVDQLDRRGQNTIPAMPWEWCAIELTETGEIIHEFESGDGDDVPDDE